MGFLCYARTSSAAAVMAGTELAWAYHEIGRLAIAGCCNSQWDGLPKSDVREHPRTLPLRP